MFLTLSIVGVQGVFIATGIYLSYQSTRPNAELVANALKSQTDAAESALPEGAPQAASPETETTVTSDAKASFGTTDAEPTAKTAVIQPPLPVEVDTASQEYTVQKGDTLTKIWVALGAPYIGGVNAAKALKEANVSLGAIRAGDKLQISMSADGSDIVRMQKKLPAGKTLILTGTSSDGYTAEVLTPNVIEQEKVATGVVKSSFSASAASEGVPYEVVDQLVDLFGTRVDFGRDFQSNDTFTVKFTTRTLEDGSSVETGPIESASLQLGNRLLVIVRHLGRDGTARYFDEEGNPIGNGFLRYPVSFTRISSVFSDSRLHPVLGRVRAHNGVDFAAPVGTPVRAAADGKVLSAGYQGFSGNAIKLQHGAKYATAYLHLSKIAPGIRSGTLVRRGDVIGYVGKTGLATGPHLHYGLYVNGKYADPLRTKLPAAAVDEGDMIPRPVLEARLEDIKKHHQVLLAALGGEKLRG